MPTVQSKHGDAVAPTPAASRKPCGCGTADSDLRKQASTLVASICGKALSDQPGPESGAAKPPAQNKQTGCRYQTKSTMRKAAETMRSQLPQYATSLAKDTLYLMQTIFMAVAIILYYVVFSYVQLVYVILTSIFYFHNADGPMKLTLTVVMATGLLILYHTFHKLSKIFGK